MAQGTHGVDANEAQDNGRKNQHQTKTSTAHGVTSAEAQAGAIDNAQYT